MFSVLALLGLLHLAPALYEDFKFARDGVATYGWYTDLEENRINIFTMRTRSGTKRLAARSRGTRKTRTSIPITTVTEWRSHISHARRGFLGEDGECRTVGRIPGSGQKSISRCFWRVLHCPSLVVESKATWLRESLPQSEMQIQVLDKRPNRPS